MKVRKCLPGSAANLLDQTDPALRVDERPFLLAPARRRQQQVGELGGLGRVVHVLHDQEVELAQGLAQFRLVDPGMGRVGGDDPEAADLPRADALDDAVVRPARASGDAILGDVEQRGDLGAMGGVGEVVPAEQVRRVREEPRAHRVALAGDRVGPGPRPADVAGHQGQVDRGLSGLDALMALVYPHRPPERDPLAPRDPPGGVDDRFGVQAGLARHELRVEPADERREFVEALGVGVDEGPVDRALLDQAGARGRTGGSGRTWGGPADGAWPPSPSRSGAGR